MKQRCYRWGFYLLGNILLAIGLTLNTKTGLGTSCIISVPYSISEIWGLNFGSTTFVAYVIFVAAQLALLALTAKRYDRRRNRVRVLQAVLQLPISVLFTRFMNLVSATVPVLAEAYPDSFPGSFPGRVLVLLLAVTLVGCGTPMILNMQLAPNPGDGIVRGLAEIAGKGVGLTKNFFDAGCCILSLTMSLLLTGRVVGIGLGTVVAALVTGRIVALFNRLFSKTICQLAGLTQEATAR